MPAKVDVEKCIGCGDCGAQCPTEAIKIEDEKAVIDAETCVDCGACVDVCPTESISLD